MTSAPASPNQWDIREVTSAPPSPNQQWDNDSAVTFKCKKVTLGKPVDYINFRNLSSFFALNALQIDVTLGVEVLSSNQML